MMAFVFFVTFFSVGIFAYHENKIVLGQKPEIVLPEAAVSGMTSELHTGTVLHDFSSDGVLLQPLRLPC